MTANFNLWSLTAHRFKNTSSSARAMPQAASSSLAVEKKVNQIQINLNFSSYILKCFFLSLWFEFNFFLDWFLTLIKIEFKVMRGEVCFCRAMVSESLFFLMFFGSDNEVLCLIVRYGGIITLYVWAWIYLRNGLLLSGVLELNYLKFWRIFEPEGIL